VASDLYCSRGDVQRWLPSGEITGWARLAASVAASTDTFTLDGHGLETDDAITVRAAEDGTLPTPLVEGTVYYAIRFTNATFKVAASAGGAAINLTGDGTEVIVRKEPPYDQVIEFYSRWVDGFLPAHAVPLSTPLTDAWALVRGLVAQLAAKALLNLDGKSSEIVNGAELAAKAQLERMITGLSVRGASSQRTNLAVTSTLAASSTSDPRGWGSTELP
jgi:hypothetical protein